MTTFQEAFMIRKLLLIALLAAVATGGGSLPALGQRITGDWYMYPVFDGNDIANMIDTRDKLYYVSANRLYSYDKTGNETYSYSTRNKLNDTDVSQIYYNEDGDYMLVCYSTGNLDLLYTADDRVVNLGDIADATLTTAKTINDVAFANGRIYVATAFGLVVFDDKEHHVIESGQYGKNVSAVSVLGDNLVIVADNKCRYAPLDIRHNSLDKFTTVRDMWAKELYTAGNNLVFRHVSSNELYRAKTDGGNPSSCTIERLAGKVTQPLLQRKDGTITAVTDEAVLTLDADGAVASTLTLPASLQGQRVAYAASPASLWAGNGEGIGNYAVDEGGNVTVLSDKFSPEAITCNRVNYIVGNADGSRVYISNIGGSRVSSLAGSGDGLDVRQRTNVLVDGVPSDASIADVTLYKSASYQKSNGNTALYGGMQRIVADPVRPDRYYIATFLEGVFVCEDTDGDGQYEEVGRFTVENMPTYSFWAPTDKGAMAHDVNFDPDGNLWVGCWVHDPTGKTYFRYSPYYVLPKDKLYGDLSTIKAEDWQVSAHRGYDIGDKDMGSVFSKTGLVCTWDSRDSQPLKAIDTKKTWANTQDDTFRELHDIYDQDGKVWLPTRWICGVEDKRGRLWFGTSSGIVEITDPTKVMNADFRFTRLKVPRNDGTNYADYLLESEQVNDIAIDPSNRKWVATENSGVYLVSENGDAILEHFTSANSDLPDNTVASVYCDPRSNLVYFGLASGLMTYSSTSSPAAEDYSDVYAYPNPVRPDYTGWITIKGLKDNSLVKIADAAGHVFYQTRSEGGMVVWDGCNADGSRVRSGVYFVFASDASGNGSSGAVTKIVVIN